MSNPTASIAEDTSATKSESTVILGRRIISLSMIAVGVLYTVASLQLDRGTMAQPGPGLYPIVVGALAITSGAIGLIELARGQVGASADAMTTGRKPWIFLAAMCIGAALLPTIGYFLSAVICGAAVSLTAGQKVLWKAALTGVGIAVASALLFIKVLDVYLPASGIDRMFQ